MQRAEHQVGSAHPADGTRNPPQPASGDEGRGQRARRVLIVEDEVLIALDLRRELTTAGFEVVGVAAPPKMPLASLSGSNLMPS